MNEYSMPFAVGAVCVDRGEQVGYYIIEAGGDVAAIALHEMHERCRTDKHRLHNEKAKWHARRIAASVNFCREFPTDYLEQNQLQFHGILLVPGREYYSARIKPAENPCT